MASDHSHGQLSALVGLAEFGRVSATKVRRHTMRTMKDILYLVATTSLETADAHASVKRKEARSRILLGRVHILVVGIVVLAPMLCFSHVSSTRYIGLEIRERVH